MNTRLKEVIKYKTGGRQNAFAALMNWTPSYLSKLLKGVDFGLSPVVSICEALPEINARWFLTGQGEMLNSDRTDDLRRQALEHVQHIMELERFIPVMTPDELLTFESQIKDRGNPVFSPDTVNLWRERVNQRNEEINAKFAAATAKS